MNGPFRALKQYVKRSPGLKRLALAAMRMLEAFSWHIEPGALIQYGRFFRDRNRFINSGGSAPFLDSYPCLFDNTKQTGIDTHYFYQSIWAFRLVRQSAAKRHLDIASDVNFVGLLTTITEVLFVDIRPLFLSIPNYHGIGATATCLPFSDNSIESLSCLHVIEHIGLGRYGDPIEPTGPEKACREISRVIRPGGMAYISVPIGRPRVSFNGQRVFHPEEMTRLFYGFELVEMAMVDSAGAFVTDITPKTADIREGTGGLDFGLGLFCLRKPPYAMRPEEIERRNSIDI